MAIMPTLLLPLVLLASAVVGDGWLGVRLAQAERPTIEEVIPGSPAAKAGMKSGDVILSINGKATRTVDALFEVFKGLNAGDWAKFGVLRGSKKREFKVQLAKRPVEGREPVRIEEKPLKKPFKPAKRDSRPAFLGIEIEESERGITVTNLVQGAPAARAGVRRGDRLHVFNGKTIRTLAQLDEIMKGLRAHDSVRLGVTRDGRKRQIVLTAAAKPGARPIAEGRAKDAPAKSVKRAPRKPATKKKPRKKDGARKPVPVKKTAIRSAPMKTSKKAASTVGGYSSSLEATLAKARRSGRPVLVVFGASWCVNSETLKKSLSHSSLQRSLGQYERVWIDTDKQSALADKYDVESLPHTLFLSSSGKVRKAIVGYQPPQILAPILRAGLSDKAAKKSRPADARSKKSQPNKAQPKKKQPRKAEPKKAQPKKAQPRKKQPRKAEPKKAQPKKTQPKKAQPPRATPTDRRRTGRRGASEGNSTAKELQRLRDEVQRLRAEQRQQRELLQRILRELQKKK
jgi:thioredoxin-related protein